MLEAVKTYQVPGCAGDFDPDTAKITYGWQGWSPGTILSGVGIICLGMPTGFNRVGPVDTKLFVSQFCIFARWEDFLSRRNWPTGYSKYKIPCWKHLDEHRNTLVRGLVPRLNCPFVHIFLGDVRDKIDCLEITAEMLNEMD